MSLVYKISIVLNTLFNFAVAAIIVVMYNQVNAKPMVMETVELIEPAVPTETFLAELETDRLEVEIEAQRALLSISNNDKQCLAQNIFFEARNQDVLGQVAIAWVTLNRVGNSGYPGTICGVVTQANRDSSGNPIRDQCQFSWYCDGKSDAIPNNPVSQRAWEDAQLIAEVVLLDWARGKAGPVGDSIMYHADYVQPYWASSHEVVTQIGDHIFYR